MTRPNRRVPACVLVLMSGVTPATGVDRCRPVAGTFEASQVLPGQGHCPQATGAFCTAGRVRGGLKGTYQFVMGESMPAGRMGGGESIMFFVGKSVVSLQDGMRLVGTDTGSIDLAPGQGGFASLITFGERRGEPAGATGQVRLRGRFDGASATTAGDYVGQVCR